MKKKLLLAPLMAVLVACVVVLSGCGGPSIEEFITEDLTTQFDEVKNGGDDFLSGLEEASGDEFEQLGIDPKEYAKTYLEGFDYEIGDVTVDEDKGVATAEVSITCKSMNKIVEDFSSVWFQNADIMTFHDPLAAVSIFEPDVCGFARGKVEIELASKQLMGVTHFTRDPAGPHEIADTVDPARFFDCFFGAFAKA